MRLSIIILSHNGRDYTLRCLDSLNELMIRENDIEIILIDNGSSDELRKAFTDRNYPWHTRIRYFAFAKNRGVAAGRNFGLRESMGSRYVMFLDNDTVVTDDAILSLLEYMDNHPEVGLAAPMLKDRAGEVQMSFKDFPSLKEKIKNVLGRPGTTPVIPTGKEMEPFYVIGACQVIRTDVVKQVGVLDEKIFFGPEDADYCMRIREAGAKVVYLPEISVVHDWQRLSHRSLFSATSRRHALGLVYFYWKWKRIN